MFIDPFDDRDIAEALRIAGKIIRDHREHAKPLFRLKVQGHAFDLAPHDFDYIVFRALLIGIAIVPA